MWSRKMDLGLKINDAQITTQLQNVGVKALAINNAGDTVPLDMTVASIFLCEYISVSGDINVVPSTHI